MNSVFVSPPNALLVSLPRPPDGPCRSATREVGGLSLAAPNGFRAEFKVRVGAILGPIILSGANAVLGDGTGQTCSHLLELTPTGALLRIHHGTSGSQFVPLTRSLLENQWAHVEVDVRRPRR